MEFDPNFYNDFTDSILPAEKLINKVQELCENYNDFGIIIDIGCGTGSTTKLLNDLNCHQIIGCDIDPKMISFAQKYNRTVKIDYLVQDFGTDWTQLDDKLKQLAGKVSLIFTNYALAWIWDKQSAANNMAKLLAPDGLLVANILYDGDIFEQLPKAERQKAFDLVAYPSEQEFIGGWVMALRNAGLNKLDIDYWEPKIVMPEKLYLDEYITIPMNWYKHYSKLINGQNQDIDKVLKKLIYEERCRRIDRESGDGQQQIEIINRLWQIVGMKSS